MFRGLISVALLIGAACSSTPEGQAQKKPEPTRPAPVSAELPDGQIVRTSRTTGFVDMVEELAEADVVYVGGSVPLARLRVAEQLHARGRLHALGMDVFPRTKQADLDAYTEARIDFAQLIERNDAAWLDHREILEFARKRRIPVLCLGTEPEILEAVTGRGLEALTEEQRRSLPALTPLPVPASDMEFMRVSEALSLHWDVAADVAVRWFRRAPKDAQLLVLVALHHVAKPAIPDRLRARIGKRHKTVLVMEAEPNEGAFAEAYADFVWLVKKGD